MRSLGPIVLVCSLGAACSAVPDVAYDDRATGSDAASKADSSQDDGRAPEADAALEAGESDAARIPVESSDTGCDRNDGETCCGSSVCDKDKECRGPGKIAQCTWCAYECAGRRCCVRGGENRCIALDDDCPD